MAASREWLVPKSGGKPGGLVFCLEEGSPQSSASGALLLSCAAGSGRQPQRWRPRGLTTALHRLQCLMQEVDGMMRVRVRATCQGGSLAFASLGLGALGDTTKMRGRRRQAHPTCAHAKDLEELFSEIDTDRKGYLDVHSLRRALSRVGLPCGQDYLTSLMQQYDSDHDGKVDFEEFRSYVEKRRMDMEKAFDKLDADTEGRHLGGINSQTLVRVLRRAGLPAREEDAQQMINMLDKDHDGVISYQEFCRFSCLLPSAQVSHHKILYDWMDSSDWCNNMEYRLSMVPPKSNYERLVAGGLAGAVSRTLVAPFERLRTLSMTDPSTPNMLEASKEIFRTRGIMGFWKGNLLTVLKTIPQSAIQFAVYDGTKDLILAVFPRESSQGLSQMEKLLSGCVAGAATMLATYPLETLRTRSALSGGSSSIPAACREIFKKQGVGGFYQGLKCGVINDMISTGLGFWSYELGQTFYRNAHDGRSPGPRDRGFIGAFSALCVMTATLPLEVVLRRLQVQGHPGKPIIYKNARHCFRTILQQEGFRAFYRGILSSYMKVGPSIGATYALYALMVQDWGIGGLRSFSHLNKQDEAALAAEMGAAD